MLVVAALGCAGERTTPPPAPTDAAPTDTVVAPTGDTTLPSREERVRTALEAAGFLVGEGYAGELDPAPCCDWESCYLFNPDNRYFGWYLPPGPGQTAANPIDDGAGRSLAWRLRPDEAVVAVGRTPPQAAYYSFRTYLHDRWTPTGREWLGENFGDSLNQFVAQTGAPGPFDAEIVVVSVADRNTERRVREALAEAGVPDGQVNVDVMAGLEARYGLHDEADTFRMQGRTAMFADEAAGEAWMEAPPFTVFRATPATEAAFEPLDEVPLRPRGAGWREQDTWGAATDALEAAIQATYADHTMRPLVNFVTDPGDDCPPGCNRDTFFGVSLHFLLPLDADAFVMVYGVNHARTGKSVYANFSVIEVEQLSAIAAVHSGQMVGTARPFLPDHPQVDDLYAWKVARDCHGEERCTEVPLTCPGFPDLGQGAIAWRAYTEAATGTGPSVDELVVDRAALFTRPRVPARGVTRPRP